MCEIIIFLIMAVCAKEHFIRLSCPIRAFIVIISVSTSGGKNSHWWQPAGQGSNNNHCLALSQGAVTTTVDSFKCSAVSQSRSFN